VPAVIVAYNKYMNSVDRFDQLRATLRGVRKEQRLTMSVFSFILDATIQNAYSVTKILNRGETRTLSDYKLDVAIEMLNAERRTVEAAVAMMGADDAVENVGGAPVQAVGAARVVARADVARAEAAEVAEVAGQRRLNVADFVDDKAAISNVTKQIWGGDWSERVGSSVSGVSGQEARAMFHVFVGS